MIEKIHLYKQNKLSESDEKRLEKALFDKMIRQDYEHFLQTKGLYNPKKPTIGGAKIYFMPWLRAAAVLLMLGGAGYWYQSAKPNTQNAVADLETRVHQNLAEQATMPQVRKDGNETVAENMQGFRTAYSRQAFEKALTFLQKIEPKAADDFYYYGLCYLYLPEPQYLIAIQHLQKANELGKEEAIWYMALAQIQAKDKVGAKQSLQKWLNYGRDWKRAEAEILLKNLN
jgi:tetratricopeptide (TPR) repeat protein